MSRVFGFILAFKEYVALTVYVAICLTLMALSRNTDMQPVRAFTTAVVGAVQSTYAWIPNPIRLARENEELRQRAIELASEVGRLRRSSVENDELRRLLGIAPRKGWQLKPAEVVGKTTTFERNMMTISLGDKDLRGRRKDASGIFLLVDGCKLSIVSSLDAKLSQNRQLTTGN
jgi:cell shape-determining protein MreC